MDDLTIEILALKSNADDLYKLRNTASTNLVIGADKKHTTIMGKTKNTSHRKQKKETAYGKHKRVCAIVRKIISRRGFLFSAMRSKSIDVTPMDFDSNDIKIAVYSMNKNGIYCYYDKKKDEIRLNLKGIK